MRRRRILSVVASCAAVSLGIASQAQASPRPAALTHAEYQQLSGAVKRISALSPADSHGLTKVQSVCGHMRDVSPLVGAVRIACRSLIALARDHDGLYAAATRCGLDPSSETAIFTCLVPTVRRYAADAASFHRAELGIASIARDRGFSSGCITALGSSTRTLAAEGRLAGDLRTIAEALRNQSVQALQSLSGSVERDLRSIRSPPGSLSLCPHR